MERSLPGLILWLVRHGQSTTNAGEPADKSADAGLTALGKAQARELALRVAVAPDLLVVSPLRRAIETAAAIRERWPAVPCETWPIAEFTYLSPARCEGTTPNDRRGWIADYWERCDPAHIDGEGAESFTGFMGRVMTFRHRINLLQAADKRFVVVVGHGQFLRAVQRVKADVAVTPQTMRDFRADEISTPLANAEIIEIPGGFTARTGE